MEPIGTLMSEHRLIERTLGALDGYAARVVAGDVLQSRDELRSFVRFLKAFADDIHHGKEEALLFERMAEHGFPRDGGPIAVMLDDHECGRALVRRLRAIADAGGEWTKEAAHEAHDAALEYGGMLRAHIQKEDRILYPMAERHLPRAEMERLGEEFESDARLHGERTGELTRLAEELEARWVLGRRTGPQGGESQSEACFVCGGCG